MAKKEAYKHYDPLISLVGKQTKLVVENHTDPVIGLVRQVTPVYVVITEPEYCILNRAHIIEAKLIK